MDENKKNDDNLEINVHETFVIDDFIDAEVIKVTTVGPDQKNMNKPLPPMYQAQRLSVNQQKQ